MIKNHTIKENVLIMEVLSEEENIYEKAYTEVLSDKKDKKETLKEKFHKNPERFLIFCGFILIFFNFLIMFIQFIYVFYSLNYNILWLNPLYSCFFGITPFFLWIYSTSFDDFNFYGRKLIIFYFAVTNICLIILNHIMKPLGELIVPFCMKIWVDGFFFTQDMVVNLARFLMLLGIVFIGFILYSNFITYMKDEEFQEKIKKFKIKQYLDLRKDKEYKYDLRIMKDLVTERNVDIWEKDLYTHVIVDGASGSGKTSMVLLPAVDGILQQKVKNIDTIQKNLFQFVKDGKGSVVAKSNQTADYRNVQPKKKYQHEYEVLLEKYKGCGMAVIAPNNDLTDKVKKLCDSYNEKCYVIDPVPLPDGSERPGTVGINPLYISPFIPKWNLENVITSRAAMFSDIIQIVSETKGKGDQFFKSVNRSCTTNFAILCMVAFPLMPEKKDKIPTMEDVLECTIDFKKLKPMIDAIKGYYKQTGEYNPYMMTLQYVEKLFMGEGKMDEHVTGLRIILMEILNNPRLRRCFCNKNTIDFDEVLANGENVVINYALEMGETLATSLGMFCVESLHQAILRRPGTEDTRIPFVLIIDELARLLTPSIESGFTLYRQFRVFMMVAFQSLSQFEKQDTLKYLQKVLLTVGNHIVFGRSGLDEMEMYGKLAGTEKVITTQSTISQTSILDESPSYSMSERDTPSDADIVSGTEIRNRDFQEVTAFITRNGSLLKPQICKLAFLPKSAFEEKHIRPQFNWNLLAQEKLQDDTLELSLESSGIHTEEELEKLRQAEFMEYKELLHEEIAENTSVHSISVELSDKNNFNEEKTTIPETQEQTHTEKVDIKQPYKEQKKLKTDLPEKNTEDTVTSIEEQLNFYQDKINYRRN